MDLADDDFFADFLRQPHSPGVTSLLRHCIGDDNDSGEINSVGAAEPGSFTESLEEAAGTSLPFPGQTVALFGANAASFSLGTSCLATTSSGTVAVGRRRGRKPKPRLPDLQERLDGLNEQFKHLSKENIFLRNKLKVLERVVPYRDESVGFLTQLLSSAPTTTTTHAPVQASAQAGAAAPAVNTAPFAAPSPRSWAQSPSASGDADSNSSGMGLSAGMPGFSGEAQSSHAPADSAGTGGAGGSAGGRRFSTTSMATAGIAALPSLKTSSGLIASGHGHIGPTSWQQQQQQQQQHELQQQQQQQQQQPHGARLVGQFGPSGCTPTVLALCPSPDGDVPPITLAALEELKRITAQEFRLLWKHICLQLGVLVTGAEVHGPGSSPYVRLERFLERALSYMDKITLLSPACFVHSMYTNVETGQPERPSDNFWITCARALQLSPQQLREVTSLAAVYEQNVVPVVQQRLQLAMQLSTRLTAATAPQRGSRNSAADAVTVLSSVDELVEQLERNVLKEHQTHWNIGDFLCSSVLTPLQVAKALSMTYPHIPDGVAMLHAFKLISEQDEAQAAAAAAAATQRAGAAPTPGALQPQASANPQPFPSLAGLLASQLPALAAGLMPGAGQAAQGLSGAGAMQQQAAAAGGGGGVGGGVGGSAGQMAAALAKLAAALPPAQLQQALAAGLGGLLQQQGAQQQQLSMLAGLRAAALAARPATQPAPVAAAVPAAIPVAGGLPASSQLQGLAALFGALAAAQQAAGAQPAAQARAGLPGGMR